MTTLDARHHARTFSLLLAAVLAAQAAGGLLVPGLYRDNAWVTSALRSTDLDALLLDLPVLLASLAIALRGSTNARLVWLGTLYYLWYNNLYYLFSAFNRFFLLYVAIFILSSFALVAALLDTDADAIARTAGPGVRRRTVAVILLASAGLLTVLWVGQSLLFVATGEVPQLVTDSGGPTHTVAALDLTTVVPPMVLGAVWLWRARPWGHVISAGMLVMGLLVVADLLVGAPFQQAAGIAGAWTMVPLWAAMGIGFAVGARLLLRPPSAAAISQEGAA
jgi:hypothetical protein